MLLKEDFDEDVDDDKGLADPFGACALRATASRVRVLVGKFRSLPKRAAAQHPHNTPALPLRKRWARRRPQWQQQRRQRGRQDQQTGVIWQHTSGRTERNEVANGSVAPISSPGLGAWGCAVAAAARRGVGLVDSAREKKAKRSG